jgi:hypothetical protein
MKDVIVAKGKSREERIIGIARNTREQRRRPEYAIRREPLQNVEAWHLISEIASMVLTMGAHLCVASCFPTAPSSIQQLSTSVTRKVSAGKSNARGGILG